MNIGDRYHLAPGIVVARDIQPEGLILAENETHQAPASTPTSSNPTPAYPRSSDH
nr:hypothetical protein [Escherichia coli]